MNAAFTERLGVCSWSLRPGSPADLCEAVRACGLARVQLALDPIRSGQWDEDATVRALRDAGIIVVSGMIAMHGEDYSTLESIRRTGGVRQDALWGDNFRATEANAALAQRLGLSLVTFHAGFLPHDLTPERRTMVDRVRQLAQLFASRGVRLALETGQETAETLIDVLQSVNASLPTRWQVGVNFDPANMILYGMGDPIDALRMLRSHARQVHAKDATVATTPGEWGTEVPVGAGQVDWREFAHVLRGFEGSVIIEREAGETRVEDVRRAAEVLRQTARAVASEGGS
ncbi:MAG: sugar phosphate isomerase/epimerase family protein [Planctomycetota bacterium]|nr:sugar phosphate isomerase/epimerase family protein [Planctomycetota bacterium]